MRLLSEANYDDKLRATLLEFAKNYCKPHFIQYREWNIHSLACTHSSADSKSILIIQGRAETSAKYLPIIYELFNAGYDIYTFDHLGQGLSSRVGSSSYSYIKDFNDYIESTAKVIEYYKLKDSRIISNSMGCAITLHLVNKGMLSSQKIALVAPMILWNNINSVLKISFLSLAYIIHIFDTILNKEPSAFFGQKKYQKPSFESNRKTHSLARFNFYHRIYEDCPHMPIGGVTFEWIKQVLVNPITEINAHNTSLLVFIAEHDFIVNNQNTTNLIERSKDGCNIETILVKNAYHDILNESDSVRNPTIEKIGTFFSNG